MLSIFQLASDPPLVVVVIGGAIMIIIIAAYRGIRDSPHRTKKGRERRRYDSDIKRINMQLSEIHKLHTSGVMNDDELETKKNELILNRTKLKVDFYIKQNSKYNLILEAFKKRHITQEQRDNKIEEIRIQIENRFK